MDDSTFKLLEAMRAHTWGYFQVHAQQRLTVFNFYVVLAGALTTGLVTSLPRANDQTALPIALGSLLVFSSFLFWRLDQRNRDLIRNAENGLRDIEREWAKMRDEDVAALVTALFSRDEARVRSAEKHGRFRNFVDSHWSFTRSFKFAFLSFALLGAGSIVYSVVRVLA